MRAKKKRMKMEGDVMWKEHPRKLKKGWQCAGY